MGANLSAYVRLLEFLSEVLGKNSEIILHDVTGTTPKMIASKNGDSGKIQSELGQVAGLMRTIDKGRNSDLSFVSSSVGSIKNAQNVRSVSHFIRNDDGELIGLLTINTDNLQLISMRNYLNSLIGDTDKYQDDVMLNELNISAEEHTISSIKNIIAEYNIDPNVLSQDDKTVIIKSLYQSGVFVLKGAVNITAKALDMSIPSVYRYMKMVKDEMK